MNEKTWHDEHLEKLNFSQKLADKISKIICSWKYILIIFTITLSWIIIHLVGILHFDNYPFPLLKLFFSIHSFFFGLIIIISQNSQKERDKIHADEDFKNNLEAKKGIEEIQQQLNKLINE